MEVRDDVDRSDIDIDADNNRHGGVVLERRGTVGRFEFEAESKETTEATMARHGDVFIPFCGVHVVA